MQPKLLRKFSHAPLWCAFLAGTRKHICSWLSIALFLSVRADAGEMMFPGADWQVAAPESESIDPTKLRRAIEYLKANVGSDGVRELVIVRNGRIVWAGDNIDKVHGVWSCTKAFTSTCLGLLIEEGKCTLETSASKFVPELATHYSGATLRHFTTMTSGYRAVGDEPAGSYLHGPSKTPFKPSDDPLFTPPGSQYAYWDSAMNMLGLVLTRAAGEPLEALFNRRIADPIGMNRRQWEWGEYTSGGGPVVNGGAGNQGKHILISAREMARFGHLFLNNGNWNGRQLISSNWIRQAVSVQVPASLPWAQPESQIDGRGCYGFNWWSNGLVHNGHPLWPGASLGTYAASGHNNNKLFVIPEWRMVVVRLGLDQRDRKISNAELGEFLRLIGHALTDGSGWANAIFEERDGWVAVEAEHFVAQEKTGKRRWYLATPQSTPDAEPDGDPGHPDSASGGGYLELLPDTRRTHGDPLIRGENFTNTPGEMAVLHYRVWFNTPGRYHVWVRAFSTGTEDNGLHVGLNGSWPESGQRMQWSEGKHSWKWDSKQRTETVHTGVPMQIWLDIDRPGLHTVSFSMREDGFEFDKFILAQDPEYHPQAAGPAPRVR